MTYLIPGSTDRQLISFLISPFLVTSVFADCNQKYFRAQDDVATPATMAKDDGVLIYAVGVGPESLRIELQQIASQPLDRHMVRVCNC